MIGDDNGYGTRDGGAEIIEPFIEHQGELRGFWLRKPRRIGGRILIARTGSSPRRVPAEGVVVYLDCRSAFGTGGHGTTEGCLVAIEKFLRPGRTVLDVGTGTGVLAIAAHKLGAGPVTAVDIDAAACREARRNLEGNRIESGVDVIEGGVESVGGRFDLVIANLRTPILVDIIEELAGRMESRGTMILSGILERELHPFLSLVGNYSLEPMEMNRIHGWMTLVLASRKDGSAGGGHISSERGATCRKEPES